MNMFEEVADLVPKSRIDEFFIAYKPWLRRPDKYMAYLRYYKRGSKPNKWGHREWSGVKAFGDDPHDAIHKLEAELMLRKDR